MKREILKHTKESIKALLITNEKAVLKAIVVIYSYQTEDEKEVKETNEFNGVGFNGADANILSSFAEQLNKGWKLSPKQMAIAKKKILKYAGQLARIANENEKLKTA